MFLRLVQQVMEAHLLKLLMGIREWTWTLEKKKKCRRHKLGSGQSCSTPKLLANRNVLFCDISTPLHHIDIILLAWCTWRVVWCEFAILTLFQTVLLCTFSHWPWRSKSDLQSIHFQRTEMWSWALLYNLACTALKTYSMLPDVQCRIDFCIKHGGFVCLYIELHAVIGCSTPFPWWQVFFKPIIINRV